MPELPVPESFTKVTAANLFGNESVFVDYIVSSLENAESYREFVFTGVPPRWAEFALGEIDERFPSRKTWNTQSLELRIRVLPTELHDCVQDWLPEHLFDWMINGNLTQAEFELLRARVGTTLEFNSGPYRRSTKEPDYFIRVQHHALPTIVVESGWSESSHERFDEDVNQLLVGGNGAVQVVIVVKWTKRQGDRVSGVVELYKNDRNGIPILEQSQAIFPDPPPGTVQQIRIRRRELFGPALLPGRNGNDILHVDVERLREHATIALGLMNLRAV